MRSCDLHLCDPGAIFNNEFSFVALSQCVSVHASCLSFQSRFHIDAVDVKCSRILTSTSRFNMTPNWWVSKNGPDHSLTSSRKAAVDVRKSWRRHQRENPSIFQDCLACLCDPGGSLSTVCGKGNGKCPCKNGVTGRRCDQVVPGHFSAAPDFYSFGVSEANSPEVSRCCVYRWNEMRRPGIFKTQGLVISGCGLKWPDPWSGHFWSGRNHLAPASQSLD